jgi:hypothetical protein
MHLPESRQPTAKKPSKSSRGAYRADRIVISFAASRMVPATASPLPNPSADHHWEWWFRAATLATLADVSVACWKAYQYPLSPVRGWLFLIPHTLVAIPFITSLALMLTKNRRHQGLQIGIGTAVISLYSALTLVIPAAMIFTGIRAYYSFPVADRGRWFVLHSIAGAFLAVICFFLGFGLAVNFGE